jgi:hypothetical protein
LEETRTVLLTFEKNILEALEKLNAELVSFVPIPRERIINTI